MSGLLFTTGDRLSFSKHPDPHLSQSVDGINGRFEMSSVRPVVDKGYDVDDRAFH